MVCVLTECMLQEATINLNLSIQDIKILWLHATQTYSGIAHFVECSILIYFFAQTFEAMFSVFIDISIS